MPAFKPTTSLFRRVVGPLQLLQEGVYDSNILRAVFLGGSMGAGKSWVAELMFGKAVKNVGSSFGLKSLAVDEVFEREVGRLGLSTKTVFSEPTANPLFPSRGHELHTAARGVVARQQAAFSQGRLGLLIDGTGREPDRILRGKRELEALGYDCSMVMVVTPLEVARVRNQARARTVRDSELVASHEAVQRARAIYANEFKDRYYEIENANVHDVSGQTFRRDMEPKFHRLAGKILHKPLENAIGLEWVTQQLAGAPDHVKKRVWQGLGIPWKPSAVDRLAALARRPLVTAPES